MGLFVDPDAARELAESDATEVVRSHRLGDFLLLLEGVSHFVYAAFAARADRSISALELEVQAEVDKYVTCLLSSSEDVETSRALRHRLFVDVEYHDDLDAVERDRYRHANNRALRYCTSLERRFVHTQRMVEMLDELRRFYRMSLPRKLEHIAADA